MHVHCRAFTVGYILEDHLSEITCTVVVCFSAFLLAEATILEVQDRLVGWLECGGCFLCLDWLID